MSNTVNNTTEQSLADKALTCVGHTLLKGYAATTHTLGQVSQGVQQAVIDTPDIWTAGRESAKANVSSILAKYKK